MGKFLYTYKKNNSDWSWHKKIASHSLQQQGDEPYCKESEREFLWINNPNGILVEEFSFLTGSMKRGNIIDQDFFSFKLSSQKDSIVLTPDRTASRTVWYYLGENEVIISSSQRAIISILKNFKWNDQAASWMLATGCLGPGHSWDKRIAHLKPFKEVRISKSNLKIDEIEGKQFSGSPSTLTETFDATFKSIDESLKWGITLSGGYDSRAVLVNMVKRKIFPAAFTWGVKKAIDDVVNDAHVAQLVANHLNVPFQFISVDATDISSKEILDNFLMNSEGRIDHLNSFTDGLRFWQQIGQQKHAAIVRADEAFGWVQVNSAKDVRISLDMNHVEDYENLNALFKLSNLQPPAFPAEFELRENESLSRWRDSLYQNYRIPYILSALHDPMLSFVEIVNPLLYSPFIDWANHQLDADRTDKRKYKEYVTALLPQIPTAVVPSIPEPDEVVAQEIFSNEIRKTLSGNDARSFFGEEFVDFLIRHYQTEKIVSENRMMRKLKNLMPFWIKKFLRKNIVPYRISYNRLVLRAFIIIRMKQIFENDCKAAQV